MYCTFDYLTVAHTQRSIKQVHIHHWLCLCAISVSYLLLFSATLLLEVLLIFLFVLEEKLVASSSLLVEASYLNNHVMKAMYILISRWCWML
jgi:hypothetical protein